MSFDAEQFVYYQVANAQLRTYPFPHFYVCPVFPDDFYATILDQLPTAETYVRIDKTGTVPPGAYKERFVCSLDDLTDDAEPGGFWEELGDWMMGDRFTQLLVGKFRDGIAARFGTDAQLSIRRDFRLVRDFTNYAISPHTDAPHKLVSLLFYLPRDMSQAHLGTSIYTPKDPGAGFEANTHHAFKKFRHVARMVYAPNSLFAFLRTDSSFHGVEPITDAEVERNLLLFNLYAEKVAAAPKEEKPRRLKLFGR